MQSSTLSIQHHGETLGTGFLVAPDLVVTCAHVVSNTGETVSVKFDGQRKILSARLLPEYYCEPNDRDIAFLRLENGSGGVPPLRLGGAQQCTPGNPFRAFGYPDTGTIEGVHAQGEILGPVTENGCQLLQLHSDELTKGFSGAPVWDEKRGVVVGMVVSVYRADKDGGLQGTAFAIPSETLWQVCPEIRPSETAPYLGLETFTDKTAQYFFGREVLTEKLLHVLRGGNRILAVFGPSGSGKSSVIRAGLLPALKEDHLPGSRKWAQIIIRPADDPFEQLRRAGFDQLDVGAYLKAQGKYERVLLFIDQFEELFTLCPDAIRERFIQELESRLANSKFLLVLAMRDEFYSAFNASAEALAQSEKLNITPIPGALRNEELLAMIERPARAAGLELEEGLRERIIEDLNRNGEVPSSTLPLLEFALTQLWEGRQDGMLTHKRYEIIDGVTGSLARWADDAYSNLEPEEHKLAEKLLVSLVHLGDETKGLPDTRRRRALTEFDPATRKVIEKFANVRLLITNEKMVELVHDALLREWGLLFDWLNENRAFLTWKQKVSERAEAWKMNRGELLQGRDLTLAMGYWNQRPQDLVELKDYILLSNRQARRATFLIASSITIAFLILALIGSYAWQQKTVAESSQMTSTAGIATQAVSIQNEKHALETAQAGSTEAAAKSALAAAESTRVAIAQGQANKETILKLSKSLSGNALSQIGTDYSKALLLEIQSIRLLESNQLANGNYQDNLPVLLEKIPTGLTQTLVLPPTEIVRKVSYSPSGELLAVLSSDLELWDSKDPYTLRPFGTWQGSEDGNQPTDFAFGSTDSFLVVGYQNGQAVLWDLRAANPKSLATVEAFSTIPPPVNVKVAVSIDGKTLAVAGNATIRLYDIANPEAPKEIGDVAHPQEGSEVTFLWFDPNFKDPYLVSGGEDGTFRVWNLRAGAFNPSSFQRTIQRNYGIADMAISSKYVVVAGAQTFDISLNFNNGFQPISSVDYSQIHPGLISSMILNSDSSRLFTAYQDGFIVEWDISEPRSPQQANSYWAHTKRVNSIARHPARDLIASGGEDSRVIIWDTSQEKMPALWRNRIQVEDTVFNDVTYSQTLASLASGDDLGRVIRWDLSNPDQIRMGPQYAIKNSIQRVAFSPDDKTLFFLGGFIYSYRPPGYLWDLSRTTPRHIFELNTTDVFAAGNKYILAGEIGDGTLKIFRWDVSGEDIVRENRMTSRDACPFKDVTFTRSGSLAAIATCTLQLWDFSDGTAPSMIKELDASAPNGVAFNADSTLLAVANADNSIGIWKLVSGNEYIAFSTIKAAHLYGVTSVALNRDGNLLVSGGSDQKVTLWDLTDPGHPSRRLTLSGHTDQILNGGIFFSSDEKTLITASKKEIILWDLDSESWITKACRIAGRNFTQLELQELIGSAIPYEKACPGLPIPEK